MRVADRGRDERVERTREKRYGNRTSRAKSDSASRVVWVGYPEIYFFFQNSSTALTAS